MLQFFQINTTNNLMACGVFTLFQFKIIIFNYVDAHGACGTKHSI